MKDISELLKPRIKMIAPIPKVFSCGIEVGQIWYAEYGFFNLTGAHRIGLDEINRYPHLFKPLAWYKERKPEEMPEYVKHRNGSYYRHEYRFEKEMYYNQYCNGHKIGWLEVNEEFNDYLPATEQQYNQYISKPDYINKK